MTSRIASTGASPPRRALVQPALPLVPVRQPSGRAGTLTRENLTESTNTATNRTDKSEDSGASESASVTTPMDTTSTQGGPNMKSSQRLAILPRSASTGNISNLRNSAGSRNSDRPGGSHSAKQFTSIDDPFLSPTRDEESTNFPKISITPPEPERAQAMHIVKTPEQDLSPRQDRLGQEVTPANAQGVHTPAACVFMANLSSQRTLDQLEYSVAKAMEIYGKSYIKVQYDKNKMPYAFVQFEKEEEARVCLTNAKGLVIDGRPIRVEHARAQRAVYLARITGGPVSNEEARHVLDRFGAIEETCQTTVADQQMHGLPEGCWVKFVYFMDCKDAIAEFRHNHFYKLYVQEKSEEGPKLPLASPLVNRGSHQGFRNGSDGRAIFVGGLPNNITEEQLRGVFHAFGSILGCRVIRKSLGGDQINVFAFIEFGTATEATAAQNAQLSVAGVPLRIEPKRYTMRRAARNNMNASPIRFTSPSSQSPVYHGSGNRTVYDTNCSPMYNNNPIGYTTTHSPHVLPMRALPPPPPPHYGNPPTMTQYTQYPSPHYTSPLGPRGAPGFDMTGPPPMYHGGPPNYYGSYMVPGGMHPIPEHEGEMGPGGF